MLLFSDVLETLKEKINELTLIWAGFLGVRFEVGEGGGGRGEGEGG